MLPHIHSALCPLIYGQYIFSCVIPGKCIWKNLGRNKLTKGRARAAAPLFCYLNHYISWEAEGKLKMFCKIHFVKAPRLFIQALFILIINKIYSGLAPSTSDAFLMWITTPATLKVIDAVIQHLLEMLNYRRLLLSYAEKWQYFHLVVAGKAMCDCNLLGTSVFKNNLFSLVITSSYNRTIVSLAI